MNEYEEIAPDMFRAARRLSSYRFTDEDLVHEAWLREGVQKVKRKYVYRRAIYDMIDFLRLQDGRVGKASNGRYKVNTPVWLDGEDKSDWEPFVNGGIGAIAAKDWFEWAIKNLNRREKLLLKLRYYESFKVLEIARVLGCKESNVYCLHRGAMRKLREKCGIKI